MDDGRDDHDTHCVATEDGGHKSPLKRAADQRLSTQTIPQRGLSDGYGGGGGGCDNNNGGNARRRTSQGSRNGANNAIGRKAFEQDFMLSTLKGVANALKSSHRNSLKQSLSSPPHHNHRRPTSAISSASTPPASSSSSSSSASSTPNSHKHHRHSAPSNNNDGADLELASNCSSSTSSSIGSNLSSSNNLGAGNSDHHPHHHHHHQDHFSPRSSISNNNFNVTMSSDHLSILESMRFDQTSDIESIKKDLIKICRENRLEILAHYVSQIG